MKAKIAVATVSGKAYYLIVSELKKKNVSFLSLKPNDDIPLDVKAVITTKKERSKITHQNVLEYEESQKLAEIVDEAIRIVKGKKIYERLVVGVDPGQNFGVAVLGDGNILETEDCTSASETVDTIKNVLSRTPANHITIRIGNGVPSYTEELWRNLDDVIPRNIVIESVGEEGTSQCLGETAHRRGKRDVSSAIKIALRQGKILPRRKNDD